MKRALVAAPVAVAPGLAHAHAFTAGADAYSAFLEGVGVILGTPGIILPLVALGVMVMLWKPEGLLSAWPLFLVGQVIGLGLAPLVGPYAAVLPVSVGVVLAVLAALVPIARLGPAVPILAGMTGFVVMLAALEGHGWGELGIPIYAGLLFGANIATAAMAGIIKILFETWPGQITRIGTRILASWVAAILVLYLAFALVGTPGT